MGCHLLIHGTFPTQGSSPHLRYLRHWQVGSLPPCHLGSPFPHRPLVNYKSGNTNVPAVTQINTTCLTEEVVTPLTHAAPPYAQTYKQGKGRTGRTAAACSFQTVSHGRRGWGGGATELWSKETHKAGQPSKATSPPQPTSLLSAGPIPVVQGSLSLPLLLSKILSHNLHAILSCHYFDFPCMIRTSEVCVMCPEVTVL